jgi:hypothetical protein
MRLGRPTPGADERRQRKSGRVECEFFRDISQRANSKRGVFFRVRETDQISGTQETRAEASAQEERLHHIVRGKGGHAKKKRDIRKTNRKKEKKKHRGKKEGENTERTQKKTTGGGIRRKHKENRCFFLRRLERKKRKQIFGDSFVLVLMQVLFEVFSLFEKPTRTEQ